MRLHHLEVTAFGPFADTVTVDFDDLSDAGLFLLTGPTGSGKTSVLDAVCFALYGDVPGDRNVAKRFRCDTAAPGVAPRVRLETTLAGRRFRLTRSPAWTRPKKRGSGTTTQQASVVVEELVDSEWVGLSTRLDEAGHLVTSLLGMTMPQFCQVAMLPQGRFQAFLRARSEDRHKLLQQLFDTQRFEDIERWVRDHARGLHREAQELQRSTARMVSRVLEVAEQPLPDEWALDDLTDQMADDRLASWVTELVRSAADAAEQASAAEATAEASEADAREAREAAHRLADLQARARAARDELQVLAEGAAEHERRLARLTSARRAAPVVPLHNLATTTARDHDRAVEQSLTAHAVVEERLGLSSPTREELGDMVRSLGDRLALATDSLDQETELVSLRQRVAAATAHIDDTEAELDRLQARAATLPDTINDLRDELEACRVGAVEAAKLTDELGSVDRQLVAHARATSLRDELQHATDERSATVDECQALKERWLDLTEARLKGMAAEMASELAVGACCPVCGSSDHPHKAAPADGAPTAEREKAARKALDDAEVVRAALDAKVHELRASLAHVEEQTGTESEGSLRSRREAVELERADAVALGERTSTVQASLAQAEADLGSATETVHRLTLNLTESRVSLRHDHASADRIAADLDALLADTNHDNLRDLIAEQRDHLSACERAIELQRTEASAADRAAEAERSLHRWLADHDFASAEAALEAVLPEAAITTIEQECRRHESRLAAARAVLDDPDVSATADLPSPDLDTLDTAADRCRAELSAARTRSRLLTGRAERLASLEAGLVELLGKWRPAHTAYAVAAELASFVEGKSTDNELRMRLSAYVLAWRLSQVVAAANERLVRMSDQRYRLEHTGRRGAGESRGGLSLLVLDEWSGELRDPATLSGGETFVVSLALALGLADVVAHEAGGVELETLFVDEGFGSLDAQTLDDVMDTLDSLRDGGRVVGVVSHVAEMRSRIPTQLAVSKSRGSGSSVTISRDSF